MDATTVTEVRISKAEGVQIMTDSGMTHRYKRVNDREWDYSTRDADGNVNIVSVMTGQEVRVQFHHAIQHLK